MSYTHRFVPPGPLGFGGGPIGNLYQIVSDQLADDTLAAAWKAGIRYFDTAPLYGTGLSEHRVGRMLRERPREEYVVSTKVGRLLRPNPGSNGDFWEFKAGLPFAVQPDYTADGVKRSIEDSLQRMGLSSIDVVYIHDCEEAAYGDQWRDVFATAMSGAAIALTKLRDEGVIKAWGLGVNSIEPCLLSLQQSDPDIFLLAGRYTLLEQPALKRLFPQCALRGVHVVVGGPYNSGVIAGGATYNYQQADADVLSARARLTGIADRHGVDLRAAALQFCAAHPVVAAVIPGTKSPTRVVENSELMRAAIPIDFWRELKSFGVLADDVPTP